MKQKHVAFIVEPVYGHLVPTLGIASELLRIGYRVSYAIKEQFETRIHAIGAEALIYQPLENKVKMFHEVRRKGTYYWGKETIDRDEDLTNLGKKMWDEEVQDTFSKLESLYKHDRPDVILYDCMNPAGRRLADALGVAAIEHSPLLITKDNPFWSYDERLVLVSIPRFFQRNAEELDDRFQFVGFIQNDRKKFFAPWKSQFPGRKTVLVSATTGLLPQIEFLRAAIAAFSDSAYQIVLSIGDQTSPSLLAPLPVNCEVNRCSANLEILETASLFVGQAGTGSVLEALYCAVPQLLVPPPFPAFDDNAIRIAELGLGTRLQESEATVENLKKAAEGLLQDDATRSRLQEVAKGMRAGNGARIAANLIGTHISR